MTLNPSITNQDIRWNLAPGARKPGALWRHFLLSRAGLWRIRDVSQEAGYDASYENLDTSCKDFASTPLCQ